MATYKKFKINGIVCNNLMIESLVKNNKIIRINILDGTVNEYLKIEDGTIQNNVLKEETNA